MATATGTEHYVSRPDGKVYYYKVGQGDPLIMLHNVGRSGWIWRNVIGHLAPHFTCYNIDMPGFDHSDVPPQKYSVGDYTKAVLDVMDSAGIEQTDILGDHTGALLGLDMAAHYPERVKRLATDGLPYWNKERGQVLWEKFFLPQFTDTTSYDIPVAPLVSWEEAVAKNPNLDREAFDKDEAIKRKSRRWIRLSYESLSGFDSEAIGPKVKVPTLLIYGEGDPLLRGGQRAHEAIENSVLKVYHGTSAEAHEAKPEESAKDVVDFLQDR